MNVGNVEEMKCNAERLFDKSNDEMEIPPIVKQKQQAKLSLAKDTSILSKTTMGNVICFLNNTLRANGRQMTMGEVLFTNAFDYKIEYENRLLGFIFGVVIFGLYFLISIMISFYILDGLLNFLELAIMWPVYVFGYAFPVVNQNFNVKNIMGKAKSFGLTMINLAVFSIFNSALLNSFYFVGSKENLLTILDKAIKNNDVSLIISSFPTDLLAITQFLFIVYCIYYIYSKLGEFASTYGGSMGQITVGNSIRNIINSSRKTFASVSRKDFFTKKSPKDADEKNTTQETVQEETVQEENTNE